MVKQMNKVGTRKKKDEQSWEETRSIEICEKMRITKQS
jgi:hypothetical protein